MLPKLIDSPRYWGEREEGSFSPKFLSTVVTAPAMEK